MIFNNKKALGPIVPIILVVLLGMIVAPGFIQNIINIFKPQPTIPPWAFIVGGLFIVFFILKNK